MKKIKRILVLCLVAAMFIGIMAIPASAVFNEANATEYVEQLYQGLLGRTSAGDPGHLAFVDQLLNQKISAGTCAQSILGSTEFRARQLNDKEYVTALYHGLLGREPDQAGLDSFLAYIGCGQSRTWVYQQFLASAEFKDRCENHFNMYVGQYPTGNNSANPNPTSVHEIEAGEWLRQVYLHLLDREPDESGKTHWLDMMTLRKMSAAGVATSIASSAEFNSKPYTNGEFIDRCYWALLGRQYDVGGYTTFINHLNSGKSRAWVFASICNSAEFQRRASFAPGAANVTPGTVTASQAGAVNGGAVNPTLAADYVKRLYSNLSSHTPTEAEINGWVEKLVNRQMSAAGVAAAFASSPEFKKIPLTREQFVERLYLALLGRSPSGDPGAANWLLALQAGYSRSWVFAKICSSAEFQNQAVFSNMNVTPGTINYASYDMG